jgi:hypothetical protein
MQLGWHAPFDLRFVICASFVIWMSRPFDLIRNQMNVGADVVKSNDLEIQYI